MLATTVVLLMAIWLLVLVSFIALAKVLHKTLADVINHYDRVFELHLTVAQKHEVVRFLAKP